MTAARVLVTGAAGFIGRPTVHALRARDLEVHAVSSRRLTATHPGITWHQADLLDPASLAVIVDRVRATHLLHLAWDMRPGAWAAAGRHLDWLRASLLLLERFAEAGGTRVVMAGSCAEYDWRGGVCSEDSTPLQPATLYGATKLALGRVLEAYARETGLSASWARVFFTLGPGEHPNKLVASVIRSLLAGQPAECTHGRQARDFLMVDDVGDALAALLASAVTGAVNIGSGNAVPVRDLVGLIGDVMSRPDLIRLGARQTVVEEAPVVVADTARLRTDVGWTPRHTLRSGVEATIAYWREQTAPLLGGIQ